MPLLSCTECAWLMQNLLKTLPRIKYRSCSRLFPFSLYFLYPLLFLFGLCSCPLFLLNELMFLWIYLYFGIRCWLSLLRIISWLCPWCQVTQWVMAEHLLTVASEKARDTSCSVMKTKSELTPKVTQQRFFAACYKRDSMLLSAQRHTPRQPFTVRGFKGSLHEPNGRSNISLCRLRVFLSAHVFITLCLMSLAVSLPDKVESERAWTGRFIIHPPS